jgi:hypothetical protein
MSIFTSFSATAGDKTVSLNWTYVAQEVNGFDFNTITQLSVYVTDKFIYESNSGEVSTTSRKLEPIAVPGSPTISYDVTDLINGREYIFCVEAILNYVTVYNSAIATGTPVALTSGIPPKPDFMLDQISPNKFRVRLYTTDTSNNIPNASIRSGLNDVNLVTYSAFDNGLPLKAIYIVYSDTTRIKTERFTIAPIGNAYPTAFEVEVRAKNWNEVNVKVENNNGISELSNSKAIYVDIVPSIPRTCQVIENITLGSAPANKLTWVAPLYLGAPAFEYYEIQRKVSTDANFPASSTVFKQASASDLSYNDTDISINTIYSYRIRASNLDDPTNAPNNIRNYSDYVIFAPSNITGVVFPTINSVTKTPSDGKFTVTVDANFGGFPQSKITYDISVNDTSKNVTGSSSNVIDISGTNGTTYSFQARVVAQSVVDGTRYYRSDWSAVQESMPYPALNNPTSVVLTPLNSSNQPLDGGINVSWTDPSIQTYINPSFSIAISYKENGTDDDYTQVVVSGITNTTITGLTNGTTYDFKIQTKQISSEVGDVYSSGYFESVVPFTSPVDVSNVIFTSDTSSLLSYSFDQLTGIAETGGLDVTYEVKIFNISNNGNVSVHDVDITPTSGTFQGDFGRQYKLTVRAYVTYSTYTFYSSDNGVSATVYTPAQPVATPSVTNITGNNVPLDEQIDITWSLPDGYDDNNVTYYIYRYDSNNNETLLNESPQSEEFYSDTGVTYGSNYTYKVELFLNNVSAGKSEASVVIMPFTYANKLESSDVVDQVKNRTTVDITFNQADLGDSGLVKADKVILNTDQSVYADAAAGTAVSGTPYGWKFNNSGSNAGKKINWYYYDKVRDNKNIKVKDLANMYCVVKESEMNVENPFFIAYTVPNGSGWYGKKLFYGSNSLPANVDKTKPILLYTGTDNAELHPEIEASNRQQLQLNSSLSVPTSVNEQNISTNEEEILKLSLHTSSQPVSYGKYDFICDEMGYVRGGVITKSICITSLDAITTTGSFYINTDQSVYADAAAGTAVSGTPYGWRFNNPDNNGKKINWYYYDKVRNNKNIQVKDIANMYCVVKESDINVENPFFIAYTVPNGSGWYGKKLVYHSNALPTNVNKSKPILLYTGSDNANLHPEIEASNRQQLQLNQPLSVPTSVNEQDISTNEEEILKLSLHTSSQPVSYGKYDFICDEMGYVTTSGVITKSVCITSIDAIPRSSLFYKLVWDHVDSNGNIIQGSNGQIDDFAGNDLGNLVTITGLTYGYKYSLKIYTGVKPGGFNGQTIFYPADDYRMLNICSYDIDSVDIANINEAGEGGPISLTLRPGNESYLADWPNNTFEIDGLTIYGYRIYSSTTTEVSANEVTNSTYAEEGLTNGTEYTVYLACIYIDAVDRSVYTEYISGTVTPLEGPDAPANIEAYSITNEEVLISWDVDNNLYPDESGTGITHYSIFIDGTVYREHIPITDAAFTRETSVDESYDRYQIVIPLTENNKKYVVSVIAEREMTYTFNEGEDNEYTETTYSVSSTTKINANSYTSRPGPAKNISYVPVDSEFSISWEAPDNSGNSDISGNGGIQYYVKLYKYDISGNAGNYDLFVDYTSIISNRSATFYDIENYVDYKIEVYAVYLVGDSHTYARSIVAELYPVQSGVAPLGIKSFTAVPTNTGSNGKQVELKFDFDGSDNVVFNNTSKFTFSIERKIYDSSSNALLSDISYNLSSSNLSGVHLGNSGTTGQTVVDSGLDASNVFLNGNSITYTLTVTYVEWLSNYSEVFNSTVTGVIPYGKPLFLNNSIIDISGNEVTLSFSKNGRPMNAIILVGIDPSNSSIPIKSYTAQQLAALNYSNDATSEIASNQSFQLVAQMTVGEEAVNIESVLAILANPGATVLESYPNEAGSDFNKTDFPIG